MIAEGMHVVIADLNKAAVEDAAAQIGAMPAVTDVRKLDDVQRLHDLALTEFGRVDVVCNNAGIDVPGRVLDFTPEDWQWIIDVNLWGVINGIQAFLPTLIGNASGGWLMNTASRAGLAPLWSSVPYSAAKTGVVALTEMLRKELAEDAPHVHVSILFPTMTNTQILSDSPVRPSDAQRRVPDTQEMRRMREESAGKLTSGVAPDVVAQAAWNGLREDRFWVFTDPSSPQIALDRADALAAEAGYTRPDPS